MTKKFSYVWFFWVFSLSFFSQAQMQFEFKDLVRILDLPPEFSTVMETIVGAGDLRVYSKLYVSEKALRTEIELPGGLGNMVILSLSSDTGTRNLMLNRKSKSYTELPMVTAGTQAADDNVAVELLGEEELDGIMCRKSQIKMKNSETVLVWQSSENQSLLRCEQTNPQNPDHQKVVILFKEFKIGKIEPGLLEIPADYQKKADFGNMFDFQP